MTGPLLKAALLLTLLTASPPAFAGAPREPESWWGLKPLSGSLATFAGPMPAALLALGVDAEYGRRGKPLSFVFGVLAATGEDFLATNAHVDFKYSIHGLSPLVIPFVSGGVGFTWGIPREKAKNKNTITGLGARTALGFDFVATPRVLPGLQISVEYGPRLLPSFGTLATAQITLGVTFVL